jgi:hypothetical protein
MKISSAFIKTLLNKIAIFDKKLGIHHNGVDNNYSEMVEALINNSVTALRCQKLMASYISGKGFGTEANNITVHQHKGISLLKFTQDVADSVSEQNGFFVHVNYNAAHEIKDMQVLPFTDCRVGRSDSNQYAGKILVCNDWSDRKYTKEAKVVDVYNPDKKVIQSQINKAGSIEKYNGQILFVHFGKYIYPLSNLHPCLEDADSEKQTSIYKNTSIRKGFFGKMLVVTRPMVDELSDKESDDYKKAVSGREEFRETIKEFVGGENTDGVMHFEMEFETDKLEESIMFKQIDSNINDKLFAHTESSVGDNIRMCFNNVPAGLIRTSDGSLFGSSGDSIRAMKEFYQDQTTDERMMVEQTINRLMKHHVNKLENLNIIPLVAIKQTTETTV